MFFEQSEATAARRRWWFVCVDDTDGKTLETGLTFSAGELQVAKSGAAWVDAAGSAIAIADGTYYYEATAGELDTLGPLAFKVEKSGVRTTILAVGQVVPWDPYASALPANVTSMAADTITASALATSAVDEIVAGVWNALTATYAAANSFGAKLGSLVVPTAGEVADAVWDEVIENAKTARQFMRGIKSTLWGKATFATSARVFRDDADTKDRISATISDDGRLSITEDLD